jgi:hypothetical protein
MSFCPGTPKLGVPKFLKLGLLRLWSPITSCSNLQLKWDLKQICNSCRKISNDMWHTTWTLVNQGDFLFLEVGSQIGSLIHGLFFGHNLCFKYLNGWCEPIWDIFVQKTFQWYKELFKPMSFDPYNRPLKIRESIRTPIPKVEAHLGVRGFIPSHFLTFSRAGNVTLRLHLSPTPLQALVTNPKAKVVTYFVLLNFINFLPYIWKKS